MRNGVFVRKIYALAVFAAMTLGLTAVPAPSQAAPVSNYLYSAATGATFVRVLDRTVQSDLTSRSAIGGVESSSDSRRLANVNAQGIITAGAVQTETSAVRNGGNVAIRSYARTLGVNLLNGLVKIDAVTTDVTTTAKSDGSVSASGGTQLAGIKVLGLDLPLNIPKNFAANIPGVAAVSANVVLNNGDASYAATQGWALGIQLLSARNGFQAGTVILLNPFFHTTQAQDPQPAGKRVAGEAYSTRIQANVGDAVEVVSDPTAHIATPLFSSGGATLTNSTATVDLPGIATVKALTSTSTSRTSATGGPVEVVNTNQTAGLNLLGGLITADAIKVTAQGKVEGGVYTGGVKLDLVKLVIAGRTIPINVSPNTAIDVAGLGKVELNKQELFPQGGMNKITALKITLDTKKAGLPVGAVIELGVASTIVEK